MCYQEAEGVRESDRRRIEFRSLVALIQLIDSNIDKASTSGIFCNNVGLTEGTTVYFPFERFHELQKNLLSNAYNALEQDIIDSHVSWNLILKWR